MENIQFNVVTFLIGCIGAMAPEIVRLYKLRTDPKKFTWSPFYIFISVLFALLGGLIAWILPATTYYGAFYAGVSTPVLISTILKNAGEQKPKSISWEKYRKIINEQREGKLDTNKFHSRISERPLIIHDYLRAL